MSQAQSICDRMFLVKLRLRPKSSRRRAESNFRRPKRKSRPEYFQMVAQTGGKSSNTGVQGMVQTTSVRCTLEVRIKFHEILTMQIMKSTLMIFYQIKLSFQAMLNIYNE